MNLPHSSVPVTLTAQDIPAILAVLFVCWLIVAVSSFALGARYATSAKRGWFQSMARWLACPQIKIRSK